MYQFLRLLSGGPCAPLAQVEARPTEDGSLRRRRADGSGDVVEGRLRCLSPGLAPRPPSTTMLRTGGCPVPHPGARDLDGQAIRVSRKRLGLKLVQECGELTIRLLDDGSTILPDAIEMLELPWGITLIHMDVVDTKTVRVRRTENVDRCSDGQQRLHDV